MKPIERPLSFSILLCALFAPSLVSAQDGSNANGQASTQITITGKADPVCKLPSPKTAGEMQNASFSGNAVTLTQLLDTQTGLVKPSTITLLFPGALCNYNANFSVSSKNAGLISTDSLPPASEAGTFMSKIPYTVTGNWGKVTLNLDTSAVSSGSATASQPANGPNNADIRITIATQSSTLPVAAGTYQDTLTVQVGPAL